MSIIKALRLVEYVYEIVFEAEQPLTIKDIADELTVMNKSYSMSEVRNACEYLEMQNVFAYRGDDKYGLY